MFPTQPEDSSLEETQPSSQEETVLATSPIMGEGATLPIVEGQPALSSAEASLPLEAQDETNGGPLGCCLGTIVGLLLTVLLLLGLSIVLSNGGTLGFATIPVIVAGTIAGGYFGWKIGKRIYKEYEAPVVKRRARTASSKKRKG